MILLSLLIATSILIGSAFSTIISLLLVNQKGVNLFTQGLAQHIPSFNQQLAQAKTMDILSFVFFILFSLGSFAIFYFLYRKKRLSGMQQIVIGLLNTIFAIFVFIATSFASYSGIQTLIFSTVWFALIFLISSFLPKETPDWKGSKRTVLNGVVVGFYLLVVLNNITTSVALPLSVFFAVPLIFYLFSKRFRILDNPSFILLIISFVFPYNRPVLAGIALITALVIPFTKEKIPQKVLSIIDKLYPAIIIFIFVYNPIFYLGNFDTIEEGFWAGWLERFINGQIMYKDFAAYQPPLLLNGLYIFTKISGYSLYNLRLYFHILQVTGLIIIYYALDFLIESKWVRFGIFAVILAYSQGLVRNNMEIRVASAVLPLLFIYLYMTGKQIRLLFVAGIFSSIAFLISVETGAASLIATAVTTILLSRKQTIIKNSVIVISGVLAMLVPFFAILTLQGALTGSFKDIVFYASVFSNGYLNTAMDRPPISTLIQWYIVGRYIQSSWMQFLLSEFSIVTIFCIFFVRWIRKNLDPKIIFSTGLAVLALVLSRSALGRSDANHIDFIWIIALVLIGYILQSMRSFSREFVTVLLCVLIFFVAHDIIQGTLLQNQFIKFQTYGNPSGSYPSYSLSRSGIITGIDVNPQETDDLVNFVDTEVPKNQKIFAFPQEPQLYFLTDRVNATSFDTPLAFYTQPYQEQMLRELKLNPPKLIIYNKTFQIPGLTVDTLHQVNVYILSNFHTIKTFGNDQVMIKNS